jgi:hypothetical protein
MPRSGFPERGICALVAELEVFADEQHPISNRENVGSSPTQRA